MQDYLRYHIFTIKVHPTHVLGSGSCIFCLNCLEDRGEMLAVNCQYRKLEESGKQ